MQPISKYMIQGFLGLLLSTGVAGMATASDEASFQKIHKDAVMALDKAASVGGEWRDSRWKKSKAVKVKIDGQTKQMSYLHAAEAYAKMGDWAKAIEYAEIARFQGTAGYQQASGQTDAGPQF